MRPLRILGISVLLISGLLLLASAVMIWRWRVPSAAARQLEGILAQRVSVPEAQNAYFDYLGFSAPDDDDPHQMGRRRAEWIEASHRDVERAGKDPGGLMFEAREHRSRELTQIVERCREMAGRLCLQAVAAADPAKPLSAKEALLLARYSRAQQRSEWMEISVWRSSDPMPAYAEVLDTQKMLLVRLRSRTREAGPAEIRETLQNDLAHWRRVQSHCDTLICKMIAVAGIRFHFMFGNLVLRELPADQVLEAVPPSWREPLSDAERSMWRVMAGEYAFTEALVRDAADDGGSLSLEEYGSNPFDRVLERVPEVIGWQGQLNQLAEIYTDVARTFDTPLDRYAVTYEQWRKSKRQGAIADKTAQYALRVATLEAVRRAALLATELRARGVASGDVAAELPRSGLRNPFTDAPFVWDPAEKAIVAEMLEKARPKQLYLY